MLTYEDAIKRWGIAKLNDYRPDIKGKFDEASVSVSFEIDRGYSCCGGSDPNCYCSFAESPSMEAYVLYKDLKGKSGTLEVAHIDFAETLREMLESEAT